MSAAVKHFLSGRVRALETERHFALVEGVACANLKPARNRFSGQDSVRPMHLFGPNCDHDYYFELPREGGAGYPINYSVFNRTPARCPGSPACELNFFICS